MYNSRVVTIDDEPATIAAAANGDMGAFDLLVREHQAAVFRVAYLLLRDSAAAEDVAQETFLRAHRSLGTFRESQPLRPWLLRIATNLALNEIRSRQRRNGWLARLRLVRERPPDTPESLAMAADHMRELDAALSRLPPRDRAVLYLRYFLELDEREMAAALNCAPGTVKSRLHRASARLRTVIETRYPGLVPAHQRQDEEEPGDATS